MIVTLEELKMYLKIQGAEEDARLEQIRSAAEDEIKRHCGRNFEKGTYTELCYASGGLITLRETPVSEIQSVETHPLAERLSVLYFDGESGIVELEQAYTGPVRVVYVGGYETPPSDLKLAVLRLAEFFYTKAAGVESESVGELKASYEPLPSDVLKLIEPYRRVRL